jgi:hypothetical protein
MTLEQVLWIHLVFLLLMVNSCAKSVTKSTIDEPVSHAAGLRSDQNIEYFENGLVKKVYVLSNERYVPVPEEDVEKEGAIGYGVLDFQLLEFYPDKSLRRAILSFDENNNLFYYKDTLGNVTFDLSPKFQYTDKSIYSSEARGW